MEREPFKFKGVGGEIAGKVCVGTSRQLPNNIGSTFSHGFCFYLM